MLTLHFRGLFLSSMWWHLRNSFSCVYFSCWRRSYSLGILVLQVLLQSLKPFCLTWLCICCHTVLQKLMTCKREMKWLLSIICLTYCVKTQFSLNSLDHQAFLPFEFTGGSKLVITLKVPRRRNCTKYNFLNFSDSTFKLSFLWFPIIPWLQEFFYIKAFYLCLPLSIIIIMFFDLPNLV